MRRLFGTLLFGLFFVLLCKADQVTDSIEKAKKVHEKEMKIVQGKAKSFFNDQERKAREKGDLKRVTEIDDQRKLFEEKGILPDHAPKDLQKSVLDAQKRLDAAYDKGVKSYTKAKKDDLAKALQKEWEELPSQGTVIEAKLVPQRKAAEMLHPFVDLKVLLSGGNDVGVKKGDPLPAGGFVITDVTGGATIPPKFVDEVLLPSLAHVDSIKSIYLVGNALNDEQLIQFAKLPAKNTLASLAGFELTSQSLVALKQFPKIAGLMCLARTTDDAVLEQLGKLQQIRSLHLVGLGESGKVTKKGLEKLMGIPHLNVLIIQGAPALNRDCVQVLTKMRNLEILCIAGSCPVADDDLKELAKFPKLRELGLSGTNVTDDGLIHLARMNLTTLNLDSSQISDASLKHIKNMTSLKKVVLSKSKVTQDGVKKLATDRSDLTIVLDSGTIEPKKK